MKKLIFLVLVAVILAVIVSSDSEEAPVEVSQPQTVNTQTSGSILRVESGQVETFGLPVSPQQIDSPNVFQQSGGAIPSTRSDFQGSPASGLIR